MLERFNPTRRFDAIVDIKVMPEFAEEYSLRIQKENPVLVFNHQTHADGIPASIAAKRLIDLAKEPKLKGFIIPVARSLAEGHQSRVLQAFFYPVTYLMSKNGLETFSYTRKVDEARYGMNRSGYEINLIRKKLEEGYGFAVFPEGSVEGGRHPKGGDPEHIFGMQEVTGNVLINACRLMKSASRGRPIFLVTCGLNGAYRWQSPNREKMGPTKEGLAALFGIPRWIAPYERAQASLGGIITESALTERFGKNWMKAGEDAQLVRDVNRFIMEEVARFVPERAKGAYASKAKEKVSVLNF